MEFSRSAELWNLLFGPSAVANDIQRWTTQKFVFASPDSYILNQSQGGPCGVLAPIQALLLAALIDKFSLDSIEALNAVSEEVIIQSLFSVLENVVKRALPSPDFPITWLALESAESKQFSYIASLDLSRMTALDFLASLVASRTLDIVQSEMDDPSTNLIERFGHCSQEVVNLMLVGKAVSNVFDRDQPMGDTGMVLHGIPENISNIPVGLLSELEYLRYVSVGAKLKNPIRPFWILGSSTHYTVLFSFDQSVNYVPARDRLREAIKGKFSILQFDEGLLDPEKLSELAQSLHLAPPDYGARNILAQSGVVILEDLIDWALPQLVARPEFTESAQDVTKEFNQLYLVNNQTPTITYSVKLYPQEGSSCEDPSLVNILHTRWPKTGVVVSPI
jgi:hypothetical protein